jgi:6-phosphogluconolactonase
MSVFQFPARVEIEQTAEGATEFVADMVREIICQSVSDTGSCNIAFAGGTTPHLLYRQLARDAVSCEVPWDGVDVFFGDERDVPHDHVESNFCMVQRALLDHVPVSPGRVHPMPADSDDLSGAAEKYEQVIRKILPDGGVGIPCFDLILLGMGSDGHTASLFPFTPALGETERLIISHFVPVLGRRRMTFTFPLINAARNIVALVTGADKAQTILTLMGDNEEARAELPFSMIRPSSGEFVLVMDRPAAHLAEGTL